MNAFFFPIPDCELTQILSVIEVKISRHFQDDFYRRQMILAYPIHQLRAEFSKSLVISRHRYRRVRRP